MHFEQVGHQLVLARAGRTRGNAFALEVLDAVDARVGAGDQLHGLGVQRTQGTQILQGRIGKLGFAVVGRVQNVGGHEGRLDVLGAQQFGVAHRSACGFSGGGDLPAVDRGFVGNQLGQHAAQGVIRATRAAGGDAEKHALLGHGGPRENGCRGHQGQDQSAIEFHRFSFVKRGVGQNVSEGLMQQASNASQSHSVGCKA